GSTSGFHESVHRGVRPDGRRIERARGRRPLRRRAEHDAQNDGATLAAGGERAGRSAQRCAVSGRHRSGSSGVARRRRDRVARDPTFKGNAELSLYLAVDYRDLYRLYREAKDTANTGKYRRLTRAEYQRIARQYAGTEQADSARGLLRRFDEEAGR